MSSAVRPCEGNGRGHEAGEGHAQRTDGQRPVRTAVRARPTMSIGDDAHGARRPVLIQRRIRPGVKVGSGQQVDWAIDGAGEGRRAGFCPSGRPGDDEALDQRTPGVGQVATGQGGRDEAQIALGVPCPPMVSQSMGRT